MIGNRHLVISTEAVNRSLQRPKKEKKNFFQAYSIFNWIPRLKVENKKCREKKCKC